MSVADTKYLQIRLKPDEHSALLSMAGNRSLQEFVRSLIWKAISDSHTKPKDPSAIDHERLDMILAEGTEEEANGVRSTLKLVAKAVRYLSKS